jgi:DNA-binding PadR family transcriptional regulator
MSGYEMKKMMNGFFGITISYGTLYPHLRFLEKSRHIEGSWESRRWKTEQKKRVYRLTDSGKKATDESLDRLLETTTKLRSMTNQY